MGRAIFRSDIVSWVQLVNAGAGFAGLVVERDLWCCGRAIKVPDSKVNGIQIDQLAVNCSNFRRHWMHVLSDISISTQARVCLFPRPQFFYFLHRAYPLGPHKSQLKKHMRKI